MTSTISHPPAVITISQPVTNIVSSCNSVTQSVSPSINAPVSSSSYHLPQATAGSVLSCLLNQMVHTFSIRNIIMPDNLFWITFVSGNISRCQGCQQKVLRGQNGKPPDDLVLQHKEHVLFQNPQTGIFQLSHDLHNVYYHLRQACITKKYLSFNPSDHIRISTDNLAKLSAIHKTCILKEFSITLILNNFQLETAQFQACHFFL